MADQTSDDSGFDGRPARPRRFRVLRIVGLTLLALLLIGGFAGLQWLRSFDDLDMLEARASGVQYFEDGFGAPLPGLSGRTSEYVPLDQIPQTLQDAVVSVEDRRFREHGGLDLRAIGRAFFTNAWEGRVVEGGSTITQQLIKISYLTPERSYERKVHEAMLAWSLENRLGKDEILERYLNRVYMGNGARGMGAAARLYFGKPVEELSLAEDAALAAIIRAPSAVNPFTDPEALRQRATLVIGLMWQQGLIDEESAEAARSELAAMTPVAQRPAYGGWFADFAESQAKDIAPQGPATFRTTLNPVLQALGERVVADALDGQPMEAALVALRADGTVAAMVGGRDYEASQFNRATQALRQPGSTFKLFVYLAALGQGLTPEHRVADRPVDLDGYSPENFGGRYNGYVSLRQAFARSLNAATVLLADYIGIQNVANAARALGIESDLVEAPSLALGTSEVTLLDLTEAYAALATGHAPVVARGLASVSGRDGEAEPVIYDQPAPDPEAERLLAHRAEMVGMLRSVVEGGTGNAAAAVPGAVGKTGTSQDYRDALFVGWNGDLVVGVWIGNDDNTPMEHVTGGHLPAEIWTAFQLEASEVLEATEPATRNTLSTEGTAAGAAAALLPMDMPAEPPPRTRRTLGDALADALGLRRSSRSCNVQACAASYRSFRASDCSYQPYGNRPRQLCTR